MKPTTELHYLFFLAIVIVLMWIPHMRMRQPEPAERRTSRCAKGPLVNSGSQGNFPALT